MGTLKLYELPDAIRELELQIIEADGELTPEVEAALEAYEGEFSRKAEFIALLSREAKAEAAAVKLEESRLSARRKAAENRERRLKDYLLMCLTRAGIQKIEGDRCKVRVQDSPESIRWMGETDAIPEAYRVVDIRPNLVMAKDARKAGEELPEGFTVERSQHVRIA